MGYFDREIERSLEDLREAHIQWHHRENAKRNSRHLHNRPWYERALDTVAFWLMDAAARADSFADDHVTTDFGPPYEYGLMYGRNYKGEPVFASGWRPMRYV